MIYRLLFTCLILFIFSCNNSDKQSNMSLNKSGDRLQGAKAFCESTLKEKIKTAGIDPQAYLIYLRAFKLEETLEVWIRNKDDKSKWQLFITYPFCKNSGQLGPKRMEGDLQIPEGFYHIDRYNPKSNFYLSLGINYPNASDKILSDADKPGSDIFIHGGCETVGCIPITDEKMAELYVLADAAFQLGQKKIPVHIFPARMETEQLRKIANSHPEHIKFWKRLRIAYESFELNKEFLEFEVGEDGAYLF